MLSKRLCTLLVVAALLAGGAGCTDGERVSASGSIQIQIDNRTTDLSQARYQAEHASNSSHMFHLHEGDSKWYMEGSKRVTVGAALDYLPHISYRQSGNADVLTIANTTYDERHDDTRIRFFVNRSTIKPTTYKLRDNDSLRIEISTR